MLPSLVFALIFGLVFFPMARTQLQAAAAAVIAVRRRCRRGLQHQTAGMTLWCQKWPLGRGSEEALANLMQTQLNDAAFQEAFHQNQMLDIQWRSQEFATWVRKVFLYLLFSFSPFVPIPLPPLISRPP